MRKRNCFTYGLILVVLLCLPLGEVFARTADREPLDVDGTISVVISNPAGALAKGKLQYPANYGVIPRTSQPKGQGDEGAPMPAIVLGPTLPAGSIVKTHRLSVLALAEGAKIYNIALLVAEGSDYPITNSIEEFDAKFPGVTSNIEKFFISYKGGDKGGKINSWGFYDREPAIQAIGDTILAWLNAHVAKIGKTPLLETGSPPLYVHPESKNLQNGRPRK